MENIKKYRYKLLLSENKSHSSEQALNKVKKKKFVTYQPKNWEGVKDLSFTMGSKWDKEALSFKFKVKEDNLVLANKPGNVLKQDHLELWFDFTGIQDVIKDCRTTEKGKFPQTAKAKHRVQLLISLKQDGKMLANYNDKEFEVKGIQRSFKSTSEGYQVNLTIPVEFFFVLLQYRLPAETRA